MAAPNRSSNRGLVERLTPLIAGRPFGETLFVIALLESRSADRYREWAGAAAGSDLADGFRSCARREDEIAQHVHRHFSGIVAQPADLPALLAVIQVEVADLFGGHSHEAQYRIQAEAERGGESLWKDLAGEEKDAETKRVLLTCAKLEAESAAFLESLTH